MPSVDSVEKAIETRRQLTEMGDKAGFRHGFWRAIPYHARVWTTSCQTLSVFVYVLANTLLPFGDGNLIRNRRVSQHISVNDGKERMADENAK